MPRNKPWSTLNSFMGTSGFGTQLPIKKPPHGQVFARAESSLRGCQMLGENLIQVMCLSPPVVILNNKELL